LLLAMSVCKLWCLPGCGEVPLFLKIAPKMCSLFGKHDFCLQLAYSVCHDTNSLLLITYPAEQPLQVPYTCTG